MKLTNYIIPLLTLPLLTGFLLPYNDEWLTNDTCRIRYLMVKELKNQTTCNDVRIRNDICAKNLTVGYEELPPYIYENEQGKVVGLLANILEDILIHSCCLHCNNVIYEKTTTYNSTKHDILLPIENFINAEDFNALPYVSLLEFKSVSFIGKHTRTEGVNIIASMFESLAKVWPIFVIAILMAICAGAIIWVFDTWYNKDNFPRPFLRGSFEGFWWAFVSMTTVGYGDRTPNSFFARLFAVLWILFGITLFNMFTAALTSAVTSQLVGEGQESIHNKKVGVLSHLAAPYSGLVKDHARPVAFDNVEKLMTALQNDEVEAVAFESLMALYHMEKFQQIDDKIEILDKKEIEFNGIGLISNNKQITNMIRSFKQHNLDSKDIIFAHAVSSNKNHFKGKEEDDDEIYDDVDFSNVDTHFYYTIAIGLTVAFIAISIGVTLNYFKHKKEKGNDIVLKNIRTK